MRIIIIDDDKLIAASLKTIIETSSDIKVISLGYSGEEAIELYNKYTPDILLMDIRMGGMSGLEAAIISKIPTMLNSTENKKDISKYDLIDRDIEIITLVSKGLSNKEISAKLFLSEGTIRNYISSILEKLNLRDRTQLAIFYFNNIK